MTLLIAGVALWTFVHIAHRVVPGLSSALPVVVRKGIAAVLLIFSVWLMVQGYGEASAAVLWDVPNWLRHAGIALLAVAFVIYMGSYAGSIIRTRIRHPQLTGFKLWATIHLLVNGDVRSLVLFGGLLAWAVIQVIILNRQEGNPALLSAADNKLKAFAPVALGLLVWVVLFGSHQWLFGVSPLG
jgi:uncharacterized membrane protein